MPAKASVARDPSQAVVIGGSLGGLQALQQLLPQLTAEFGLPLIVVLHQHRHAGLHLGRSLTQCCRLPVVAIEDKAPIAGGRVYLCPANYHVLIEPDRSFALSTEPPVNFARPSIDVCFESAARAYGRALVGVVLSGASQDGAAGLRSIKAHGGLAFCQNPVGAMDPTLPLAAQTATALDRIGSPGALGLELLECSR